MSDFKFAFRQLLKNPGFTVHPPQCCRPDRVQFPQCCSRKPSHLRRYCYGGRAVVVLTLALGIEANTLLSIVHTALRRVGASVSGVDYASGHTEIDQLLRSHRA